MINYLEPGGLPAVLVPPQPPTARQLFGAALPSVEQYAGMLCEAGVERGLIGPGEAPRIWTRHLMNCGVLTELIPAGTASLADLGSGAGLPGIVLAVMMPQVRIVLVEPMARRTAFLRECATELGLTNVEVRRGRAEDQAGKVAADVVVARAVAPLSRLAGWAAGLARPGGLVLAVKGSGAAREMTQAAPALLQLGARDARLVSAGQGKVEPATSVVSFRTSEHVPARSPGQPGRAASRGPGAGHGRRPRRS